MITGYSQGITEQSDTSKSSLVTIDKADKVEKLVGTLNEEILILTGNVLLHQDSLFMQCDSAKKENNYLTAVGNVLLQQWDSVSVFAGRLQFNGDSKDAYLRDSVVMQSKTQKLFTDSLAYNTKTRIAQYDHGATLTNDTIFLYSRKGTFFLQTEEVYFKDSVYIQNEDFELFADTLLYNTGEQKPIFWDQPVSNLQMAVKSTARPVILTWSINSPYLLRMHSTSMASKWLSVIQFITMGIPR
ncbi:MAG: hypothetical protein IPL46_27530 [Saprospiraceae bacterium]|nr:hypothetical protein [Saprospiraceae bacterium]